MLGAVMFDVGGSSPSTFVMPDASGLTLLSLPESFLEGHNSSSRPSAGAVLRFEEAMSDSSAHFKDFSITDQVRNLQRSLSLSIDEPSCEKEVDVCVDVAVDDKGAAQTPAVVEVKTEVVSAERPAVADGKVLESIDTQEIVVDKPMESSEERQEVVVAVEKTSTSSTGHNYEVSAESIEKAVPITNPRHEVFAEMAGEPASTIDAATSIKVSVELPTEVAAVTENPEPADVAVRLAGSDRQVVAVDKPAVAIDRAVAIDVDGMQPVVSSKPKIEVADLPDVVVVERLAAVVADKPKVDVFERPSTEVLETPKTVAVERPPEAPAVKPAILVETHEAPAVVRDVSEAIKVPIAPSDGRVAVAEKPIAVYVEKAVVDVKNSFAAVEKPVMAVDDSVVIEKPVTIDEPVVAVDKPVVVEKHVAVDEPVVAVDKPTTVDKPATVDKSTVVEKSVAVDEPAVVVDKPVAVNEAVVAVDKPVAVNEAVVAVNKPVVAVDTQKSVAVDEPAVAVEKPAVVENLSTVDKLSSDEKPVVIDEPVVAVDKPSVVETPVAVDKSVVVETSVAVDKTASVDKPVAVNKTASVDKPVVAVADRPSPAVTVKAEGEAADMPAVVDAGRTTTVVADRSAPVPSARPAVAAADKSAFVPSQKSGIADESDVVLQSAPIHVQPPENISAPVSTLEVDSVSAATARTEAVVDTVNKIVEAVVGQIEITPSLIKGEGEVRMTLKPTVLDGSEIRLTAKDGELTVAVTPSTPEAAQAMSAAMPRLETALAEHVPAFRHVAVKLVSKKGSIDETA